MSKLKSKILVVDDNVGIRAALNILLSQYFGEVELLSSPKELLLRVRTFRPDVVLLDMNFESDINTGNEGLFWLSELKRNAPNVEVVLFTAYADIALAVEGMKRGAFDFVVKPWDNAKLLGILEEACGKGKPKRTAEPTADSTAMLWGDSPAMNEIHRMVGKIAPTEVAVLITGENGTGKDVLANEIHRLSLRSGQPMVSVDIGAIAETLFESELFGHVKGAFTDACSDHVGKFEQANGTTLFLDEIGNIPLSLQAKLLRVLQNRCLTKVGDTKSVPIDIRLICATNMDLPKMVREGRFREDLFYRINTVTLQLPPLRERTDEISSLAALFVERFTRKYHREVKGLTEEAVQMLQRCRWDGNIRELQNCIEKMVILSDGSQIDVRDLQEYVEQLQCVTMTDLSAVETLGEAEERTIRAVMEQCAGNLSMVAKILNISRPTLYSKLKKYGI